jgi:hypothetical protein
MPGGPSGELVERERVLDLMGVARIQAPRAVFMRASEGKRLNFGRLFGDAGFGSRKLTPKLSKYRSAARESVTLPSESTG